MNINEAFPSAYLKAADLQGRQVRVIIDKIQFETLGDDRKAVLYFRGKDRGVVLNKTNANNISNVLGDETDEWIGQEVILYGTMVDFQGKSVAAIRIKVAPRRSGPQLTTITTGRQNSPPPSPPPAPDPDLDDPIPF